MNTRTAAGLRIGIQRCVCVGGEEPQLYEVRLGML